MTEEDDVAPGRCDLTQELPPDAQKFAASKPANARSRRRERSKVLPLMTDSTYTIAAYPRRRIGRTPCSNRLAIRLAMAGV